MFCERTRDNNHKFKLGSSTWMWEKKNKHFHKNTINHRYRLPSEAAETPSLEVFKICPEKALSNLVYTEVLILLWAGGQDRRPLKVTSNLNDYVILQFQSQANCFSCFLCQRYLLIPAPFSGCTVSKEWCDQVAFPHSHYFMVYLYPKNASTTRDKEKVWY